ncbi:MAG: hypothetical protein ABIU06_07210 [Anaerolineales bacterium]
MSTEENKAIVRRYFEELHNKRHYIARPRSSDSLRLIQVGDKLGYINKTGDQ